MATLNKTKTLMIDVARRLFARYGVQNTTMNDIADAAHKGRRTLYTYFKSKNEIVQAIVEQELSFLHKELEVAKRLPMSPDEKLINLIYVHLETVRTLVLRNGSLRAEFFRDIWQVERSRSEFDRKETLLIQEVLEEGIRMGMFEISHAPTMAYLLQNAVKGMEVPYISGHIRLRTEHEYELLRESVVQLVFRGIRVKETK
ncbi:TetR/AcrR family transcriptional regulator [Porphyromonas sp. COT-239 OH1446]|uniref:TetR/AcrR family transcriptional regulator n=1 Tax=Porphyromonas sp. COT-239 OH1446 TaxID=1515613 RepID=UPI00052C76AE|nr:TetR/AcrR family transcriptional regulator [Porphyromonas sp. COT-239 OH1446]KGN71285.1 TetR family transcriptional regulator [Porphyromonas sp. COT-239 OH1446]